MPKFEPELRCTWWVATGGYAVRRKVIRPLEGEPARRYRKYSPLEMPGLFMDFAAIEKTPAAIVAFANKYGDISQLCDSETTLEEWYYSIDQIGELIALGQPGAQWEAGYEDPFHPPGGIFVGGNLYLCPGPSYVYWPSSLFGALQLQASMALVSGTVFVRCTQCGRHIALSPKMRPGGPYYCSDTCKVQSYRDRKATAVEMVVEQGKSVAQAAASLGSSVSTVTGWVGGAKPKRKGSLSLDVTTTESAAPPPKKKGKKQ